MTGRRVLSVHYDGKVYSIYEIEQERLSGKKEYRTFIGRRRLDTFAWFTLTNAIGSILCEINEFDITKFKEEW